MSGQYWKQVHASGLAVPSDRALGDLTAELTRMLGDTDPRPATGPRTPPSPPGSAEASTTTCSRARRRDGRRARRRPRRERHRLGLPAQLLRAGPRRVPRPRQRGPLVAGGKVLEWGDRLATWLLRERDLRGFVPGKGWAHAVAHGADALGTLARSPHVAANELTVILDVLADRLLLPVERCSPPGSRTGWRRRRCILRRDRVPLKVVEPWVARLVASAAPASSATATRTSPGQRRGLPPRALPPTVAGPTPTESAPTCCWCWSTPCAPATLHLQQRSH